MELHCLHFRVTSSFQNSSPAPHAGQVILLAGGSQVHLDPDLVQKGVIFTDLVTAEREHPSMVDEILGTIVHPREGKFASLAGALGDS